MDTNLLDLDKIAPPSKRHIRALSFQKWLTLRSATDSWYTWAKQRNFDQNTRAALYEIIKAALYIGYKDGQEDLKKKLFGWIDQNQLSANG